MSRAIGLGAALLLLASHAIAAPADWDIDNRKDSFTDLETCHAQLAQTFAPDSPLMIRAVRYAFFIERRGTSVRVGFENVGPLPSFPGVVQLRVDDRPVVNIVAADTPTDLGRANSGPDLRTIPAEQRPMAESIMRGSLQAGSRYRALEGKRATALLGDMLHGRTTKWRVLGITDAYDASDEIPPIAYALAGCGITLP
ncbi:MAG TPA: hypothetical protein VHY79_19225 [Rhizomicrobium sp.]|jgi:hypothetical protein|nr:hypothetical protein [Rhizomicrobium sp.]